MVGLRANWLGYDDGFPEDIASVDDMSHTYFGIIEKDFVLAILATEFEVLCAPL